MTDELEPRKGRMGTPVQVMLVDAELAELDALVERESAKTGFRVGRAAVIRRMVQRGLSEAKRPRGGK